jgi:uncharacterized damage-inducible protein DinB
MKRLTSVLSTAAVFSVVAGSAWAQNTAVSGLGAVYGAGKNFLVRAAEQMPEEHYGFKPTPEVRSFGQIVGHVANSMYFFCSTGAGEANPKEGVDIEKTVMEKAGLVQAIKDAFTYCDKAYQIPDAKGMEPVDLFGMKTNRLGALAFNAGHNYEHYGNLVTYMRLKGLTPPSSQRGM